MMKLLLKFYRRVPLTEENGQKKRKAMYEKGITNYRTKEGIKMTIREDGTEYIDKCDMPA